MTFSIVARCPETGMLGMAVSSSSPAVAARCAHVRAGVGAVASQNVTDPALAAQIGAEGRKLAIELFGKDKIKQQWADFLDRAPARLA